MSSKILQEVAAIFNGFVHIEPGDGACRTGCHVVGTRQHYGGTVIRCVRDGAMRSMEDIHEEIYRHIAACLEV